jgi:hypothetical protein
LEEVQFPRPRGAVANSKASAILKLAVNPIHTFCVVVITASAASCNHQSLLPNTIFDFLKSPRPLLYIIRAAEWVLAFDE